MKVIAQWKADRDFVSEESGGAPIVARAESASAGDIENWLVERIATRLQLPVAQVRVTTPFLEFGISSVDAVEIAAELERWLGRRMSPTAIYNYPNIAALAAWLSSPPSEPAASAASGDVQTPLAELNPQRLLDDVRQMTDDEMQAFLLGEMAKQ